MLSLILESATFSLKYFSIKSSENPVTFAASKVAIEFVYSCFLSII